jgi:hypothetical protein
MAPTQRQRGDVLGRMEEIHMEQMNWEQLEKRYNIVIEGNVATVTKRGLFGFRLLRATAVLGTKAVEVKVQDGSQHEVDHDATFTESNLADELKVVCLFTLAQWEMAQAQVAAGA